MRNYSQKPKPRDSALASRFFAALSRYKYLYLMLVPGIALLVVFRYGPMYGNLIAFQKYRPARGIFGSPWIGFDNFAKFFKDPYSYTLIKNTILLGVYNLLWTFPAPIILALMFNEVRNYRLKKYMQTLSYLPYFISTVVIVGIVKELCSVRTGLINQVITGLGHEPVDFFIMPEWFRTIYIASGIWQGIGFGTILYLAAIASIDIELYESAVMDGSNRFKNMVYITVPSMMPTISVMLILAMGGLLGNDFTKILLIYSPITYDTADVLQTYTYRLGVLGGNYGYTGAVSLLNSAVSFIFLYVTNLMTKKIDKVNSLW